MYKCTLNDLTLRNATQNDSDFAYHVKRVAFKAYVELAGGWNEDEQRQWHDQRFQTQDFRVITLAGIDVGVMALDVAPDSMAVHQLFILPEYQDKGIGHWCMSCIIDEAYKLGLPVRLRVLKVNSRAQAFYHRLGFIQTGETDTHWLMEKNACS